MKLKPCPFCGSQNIAIMCGKNRGKRKNPILYRVSCRECLAKGPNFWVQPWHSTKFVAQGQAEKAWNERTSNTGEEVQT